MYAGIWDTIANILGDIGITGATSTAIARALASPTMANIRAVESAFAAEGTSAPPELLDLLYKRYADAVASYPAAYGGNLLNTLSELLPWLAIGMMGVFILSRSRKR